MWRSRGRSAWVLLGAMLAACGSEREHGAGGADLNPAGTSYDPCYQEEAGEVTVTSLDFADERVASHVQLVQRRHEAPLFWDPIYRTEVVRGFEPGTVLAVDVTVLDVIETDFVPAPSSACEPRLTHHMNAEVRLATADGALVGSLPMVLTLSGGLDQPPRAYGTAPASFDDFVGSFDVGLDPLFAIDPNVELRRTFGVTLGISEQGLYASIQPNVSWPRPDGELHLGWSPGRAVTETFDCLGKEVPLDGTSEREPEIRRAWDDVVRAWPSGPIEARWGEGLGMPTEVTLGLGSPLRACFDGSDVRVLAPLSVSTADGAVQGSYELLTYHHAGGAFESHAGGVFIPVPDFERVTGVRGVEFGEATHGRVDLLVQATSERFSGGVDVSATDAYAGVATGFPQLGWCVGEDCW